MNYVEHAIVFPCRGESLLGILSKPELPNNIGVLIAVGGPQYRVGSHRQFVLLSRALAKAGYPVFRFDYRGMGDSTGTSHNFETVNDDFDAAINAFLSNCSEVETLVLWGLCDAASASLLYWDATHDERIAGMILLNPWVRSEASLAKTHIKHYYGRRLLQAEFWKKLLTGRLEVGRAITGLFRSLNTARQLRVDPAESNFRPFQNKMLCGLANFPGKVLVILSENDYTAMEFDDYVQQDKQWIICLNKQNLLQQRIEGADHTFSSKALRERVELMTQSWLGVQKQS